MEASLTCAVCLGVFRDPVTLPYCSHNFCKDCVLECATPDRWTMLQPGSCKSSTVVCPLCRKVSILPGGHGGLVINTTLAEVVKLLPQSGGDPPGPPCAEHPDYTLQLFCKNCEQACCGRCVSLRHQGSFHNVNLLDVVFQEEKLLFYSRLKTLREMHKRLAKEISDEDKNTETILKANEDTVISIFDEVQKALDVKKKQLLDIVKQQQSASIKRSEVRKVAKAHHKATVEGLLKTCETIMEENEPRSFLQVACGLNKRMKSNLELMEFSTDNNDFVLKLDPECVDAQPVLDAVSALKFTSGSKDVSKPVGSFFFKSISRTWNRGIPTNEKYCPVQDQELLYLQGQMQKMSIRFVCITKMPVYQHLSHEELRLKYYEPSVVQPREGVSSPERPRPFVFNNVNNFNFKMSTSRCLTTRSPSDITMGKTAKLCNAISNKSLLPNCLEKSAISTIKKSGRNEKPCKKLKSAACLLKFGSVLSLSAVTDRSANVFGNTEEDMLVSSASSSEEFEDATSNIEADVEESREGSSSRNTDGGESSSFQKNQL